MHRTMELLKILSLGILLTVLGCISAEEYSLFDCSVKYKCSGEKALVWATADERCFVFHNKCLMRVEQCARSFSGRSELIETDRETCKPTCTKDCLDLYEPVCAQIFQEEYITFSNECEMRNNLCENERPYSYFAIGECVESPVG
ncbi:uncharacterized protein [Drosophila pseudoobscura]|uniref:Kazal-like domain-containing protein n=1 Tax=Drosophila pseudoobscura pseudoobscura TaxID=46245 RepID=A0A6I8V2J0_DROPS|nr:uncharacterized protein LOC6897099 [Drosophila pseudoobscura]